ncbi:MAG TPA: phenylalanine--tRNA ligase subunit beta, partial [Burkholderiaceae bacterium]
AIGFVGELHPKWRQSYDLAQPAVLFELDLEAVLQRTVPVFRPVSKHQAVERDIALVVAESVGYAAVVDAVRAASAETLRDVVLFDVYRPKQAGGGLQPGEKSLALRLTLGTGDATMTEPQIEAAVQSVVAYLQQTLGARLRA